MRTSALVLSLMAGASMAMAAVGPVTSVTVNTVPGTTPQYWLQSITVGGYTVGLGNLATGTSAGFGNAGGVTYSSIANMDSFDLNLFVARSSLNAPTNTIDTVLFGGANWVDLNGSLPDFFLFEAAASGNPDDVGVAPIFPDGSIGLAIDLPQAQPGWGLTGFSITGTPANNGQPILGVSWDITDLKDASGNFLSSSAIIMGIRIMNGPVNLQAGGLDPALLCAVVPEPGTMTLILLGLGGLTLFRKRF